MIKWKKRLLPVVIAAVLLCLTACSGQTHTADLYEKGVELSEKMGMLAKDENYLAAMISSSEGLDPLFEPVASLDYQNPKATFIVTNIEQTISQLYTQLYGDYPEEIRDIPFMRLILQPLIENSLYHGIKPLDGTGFIKLKILSRNNFLYFSVIDTGVGMTKQEVNNLLEQINQPNSKRIGLSNVNNRLIMQYGKASRLKILSKKGMGTCISFKIPISP